MQEQQFPLTYSGGAAPDPLELLLIKQADWPTTTGVITTQEMLRMVGSSLVSSDYAAAIDCGLVDGAVVCDVYVYPLVAGLAYQLLASWGTLTGPQVEMLELTELVQFKLTDQATPELPARQIKSVSWVDDCYGKDGEIVPAPALSVDGEMIRAGNTVYGTANVRYLCERHTYQLTAPRRETSIADNYGSILVGVYEGGLVEHKVELPPGIAAFEADADAVCGASWSSYGSLIDDDEQEAVPVATPANKLTIKNYCTQKVTSETYS